MKYKTTRSLEDRVRLGRPRVTTKAEDKSITLSCKRDRRLTAQEITSNFNSSHAKNVSEKTVRVCLKEAGLNGRVAVRKPLLRSVNRAKTLQWAKHYKNWTEEDWRKVLWTDESKFVVFGSKRRTYVRRKSTEKFHPQCVKPTLKHGGGSVLVWGCFASDKVGSLFRVKGILDQKRYHNICKKTMSKIRKPFMGNSPRRVKKCLSRVSG